MSHGLHYECQKQLKHFQKFCQQLSVAINKTQNIPAFLILTVWWKPAYDKNIGR